MSDREPSLIELLVSTAVAGMQTTAEIACVVVFVGSMLMVAKLLEPQPVFRACMTDACIMGAR